jgi:hypothetical protein
LPLVIGSGHTVGLSFDVGKVLLREYLVKALAMDDQFDKLVKLQTLKEIKWILKRLKMKQTVS